jgi:phage repressor protein C with HTH and peptisase S24 domain
MRERDIIRSAFQIPTEEALVEMSAAVIPTLVKTARFSVLQAELSGDTENIGILLEDPARDRLYLRLRRDWDQIAGDEAEVFAALEEGMRADAAELGAAQFLEHLEETLSNQVRISDRKEIEVEGDFEQALNRLYRRHVRSVIEPFVSHLPRYSLAVAAGKFLENAEVEAENWEEVPADLRVTEQMFVATIAGKSMEPKIPDGSLCVFKLGVTGSREGRLVLVEALGRGANDRYTVKRYHSEKQQQTDGTWSHARITLQPLNPEFDAWDLSEQEDLYRILAEFVCVLD